MRTVIREMMTDPECAAFRNGSSRWVMLTKRYAVKFPLNRDGYEANRQEIRRWHRTGDERLCPILFGHRNGIVVIMPRAEPLTDDEFSQIVGNSEFNLYNDYIERSPGDFQRKNLGKLDGKIVWIDYEDSISMKVQ